MEIQGVGVTFHHRVHGRIKAQSQVFRKKLSASYHICLLASVSGTHQNFQDQGIYICHLELYSKMSPVLL